VPVFYYTPSDEIETSLHRNFNKGGVMGLWLKENYHGGKILIHPDIWGENIIFYSGLSFKEFIEPHDDDYWKLALKTPWYEAEYVVFPPVDTGRPDPIYVKWGHSPHFHEHYRVVFEGPIGYKIFQRVTPVAREGVPAPDLVIKDISSPDEPYQIVDTKLEAVVTNQGNASAKSVIVRFYDNGNPIGEPRYINVIAPGSQKILTLPWKPEDSGDHKIEGKIVATGTNESDITNNNCSASIYVHRHIALVKTPLVALFLGGIILVSIVKIGNGRLKMRLNGKHRNGRNGGAASIKAKVALK
jgi:hypothetical protein